jgi:hypothetical protein
MKEGWCQVHLPLYLLVSVVVVDDGAHEYV